MEYVGYLLKDWVEYSCPEAPSGVFILVVGQYFGDEKHCITDFVNVFNAINEPL